MEAKLEQTCEQIDEVLLDYGYSATCIGGYVYRSDLIISLSGRDVIMSPAICREISHVTGSGEVVSSVGILIVKNWQKTTIIEGEIVDAY